MVLITQRMKNSDLVNDIANINNLMLAWEKLEGEISHQDDWCDIMELYAYKFQLKDKLADLHARLVAGTYQMRPLRPLPFPKGASKDENGEVKELRVRQYFHVYIEDQLVWIAYCNVIAQYVERRMPGWSFGNRTDVRVWYRDIDGKRELKAGNYRNTRDRVYKTWGQSWPRYRKLLSLTIKMMSRAKGGMREDMDLSEEEKQLLEDNERFPEQKLYYLEEKYFSELNGAQLYWAGIDIEKFYPEINRELITKNLGDVIYDERQTAEFWALTNTLLDFKIDVSGFTQEELDTMKINGDGTYPKGLPTGLLEAGFLSNLALLGIDEQVKHWLAGNHKVAHFRYVDDHVVLAQDRDELLEWVKKYKELLDGNGFTINEDKMEPKSLSEVLKATTSEEKEKAKAELKGLDPTYPQPLMTVTLQKVSQMADMNVDQLTKAEFDMLFSDLQELLVMDISDQEIKKETRISFAVTMLSRILVHGDVDYEELGRLKQELRKELETSKLIEQDIWKEWFYRNDLYPEAPAAEVEGKKLDMKAVDEKRMKINDLMKTATENAAKKHRYIFKLIVKAIEDVPERTRIWIRMLQFCYKHSPENLGEVFNILNGEMISAKLHPLDILYLRMMLLNRLALLVVKDMPRKDDRARLEKATRQLAEILKAIENKGISEKYYVRETFLFVERVLTLEQTLAEKTVDNSQADELYFGEQVDMDFWVLLYLQFVSVANVEKKDEIVENALHGILTTSVYYPTLFLKCMSNAKFQQEVLKDASLDTSVIDYIKRHHLEIDVYRSFGREHRNLIASFLEMWDVEQACEGYMTLSEWVFRLMEYKEGALLHTEHLEYIALKVVLSLIKTMDENHKDIFHFSSNRYINLFNLCVKNECAEKIEDYDFWDEASEITKYEAVQSVVSRYPFDWKLFPSEYCDVYDIGVILLQMLTLDHLPSDYLVDAEYGYKWERIIKSLLKQGYMSFYTYMILMACLSKRNRETMQFVHGGMNGLREDYDLDPPIISNLQEMEIHVERAIKLLKENRVSLPNHKNRALSVISLESYRQFEKKVKSGEEPGVESLCDFLKVDIIQTNMDHRQAWSGLKRDGYGIMESEMQKCWNEIVLYFKQIMNMDLEVRPQIVVLPEFAFDKGYYGQLKKLSDKTGCLVIAGRNFVEVPGNWIMNKAAVLVPFKWPNGSGNTSTPDFEFGKYFFADVEKEFIEKIGYTPKPYDKMYLIDAGKYGKMGLAICADFYDIERFTIYRGRIQHLFIIAYNKDVKSFYYLAEAISRIVFCNVVICNTGFYGGSIAFAPYKEDYKRYVYKHEGGNLYTNQIILLPVASLYDAQKNGGESKFKSCPPGYQYRGLGVLVKD